MYYIRHLHSNSMYEVRQEKKIGIHSSPNKFQKWRMQRYKVKNNLRNKEQWSETQNSKFKTQSMPMESKQLRVETETFKKMERNSQSIYKSRYLLSNEIEE